MNGWTIGAAWVGAVSGVISLVYNVIRFQWDQGAETRATQASIRADLRAHLEAFEACLKQGQHALSLGKPVGEVPSELVATRDFLGKNCDRITSPDPAFLRKLEVEVFGVEHTWDSLRYEEEDFHYELDAHGNRVNGDLRNPRRVDALIAQLRERLKAATSSTQDLLKKLNDIDKGSQKRPPASR